DVGRSSVHLAKAKDAWSKIRMKGHRSTFGSNVKPQKDVNRQKRVTGTIGLCIIRTDSRCIRMIPISSNVFPVSKPSWIGSASRFISGNKTRKQFNLPALKNKINASEPSKKR